MDREFKTGDEAVLDGVQWVVVTSNEENRKVWVTDEDGGDMEVHVDRLIVTHPLVD